MMKTIENFTPIYDLDDGIEYSLGKEFGNIWNRILSHSPCGCARVVQVGVETEVHNQECNFVPPFIRIPDESDRLAEIEARLDRIEHKVFPKYTHSISLKDGVPALVANEPEFSIGQHVRVIPTPDGKLAGDPREWKVLRIHEPTPDRARMYEIEEVRLPNHPYDNEPAWYTYFESRLEPWEAEEREPEPTTPPPTLSKSDWSALEAGREFAPDSSFTTIQSEMFIRLLNHSRHCAKHHVLSAEEREALKQLLDHCQQVGHSACINVLNRLLPTLSVKEDES